MTTNLTRREFSAMFMAAAMPRVDPKTVGVKDAVTQQLRDYLQSQIDARVVPGAKVMASRHGKTFIELFLGTYCDQNARHLPCEASALHPFFSVSKMVSATAVVMAAQDGLIELDAPVARYVPEFAAEGKGAITIRQCLTHSAGIPQAPPGKRGDTEEHWKDFVAAVCVKPLEWEPGTRTMYHGANGILIAAEAVRRKSNGKTWNTICRERIFSPLKLDSITFDAPPESASVVLLPPPNQPAAPHAFYAASQGLPGAGCKSNIADLLAFLRFQTNGGKPLLQEKYWTEMHTDQFQDKPVPKGAKPGFESWGLGMMVRGERPPTGGLNWFGIHNQTAPKLFSHVGTDCAMGVGDPGQDLQIAFFVTDSPVTKEKAGELRNKVTDTIYANLLD